MGYLGLSIGETGGAARPTVLLFDKTYSTNTLSPKSVLSSGDKYIYFPEASVSATFYELPAASSCTGKEFHFLSNDQVMNIRTQSGNIYIATESGTTIASGLDKSPIVLVSDGSKFIGTDYSGNWTVA